MKLYIDADIFLALIKSDDRHKKAAQTFLTSYKEKHIFVTSTLTCMEVWFYLYKNNLKDKILNSIRAISAIAQILEYGVDELEAAAVLAEHHALSPADSVHAFLALQTDGIVSSDASFDRIKTLKRIDFSINIK